MKKWRKSSYSNSDGGACVELAEVPEGVEVRNSNRPELGVVTFERGQVAALIAGIKAGEFDDLA